MNRILRLPTVMARTGLAKSTVYKKVRLAEFPRPISLGSKSVGWLESDVNNWIEQQIARSANDNSNRSEW